jgi:hypothetical protein
LTVLATGAPAAAPEPVSVTDSTRSAASYSVTVVRDTVAVAPLTGPVADSVTEAIDPYRL